MRVLLVIFFVILSCFGVVAFSQETHPQNENICLDREQIEELKLNIQQIGSTAKAALESSAHWYGEYKRLKSCVQGSQDHLAAVACTGVKIATNEDK